MATKSFTTKLTFNRKNADALIKALAVSEKPDRVSVKKVQKLDTDEQLKQFFAEVHRQ